MHAYAASGQQAPRIRHGPDGTPCIECPRCGGRSSITSNNCPSCGVPFTMEGVPTSAGRRGSGLATTALVLGIVSLCLFQLVVVGPLAILFALASWMRSGNTRPSGMAIAGAVLGIISLTLSLGGGRIF